MIKIEIKSIFGDVLFSYEKENNTIKETVEQAIKEKVSLDGASLIGASLDGASLNHASLDGASLDGASLDGASLNHASLDGASLIGASLNRASLNHASLNRASLNHASLDGASLIGASLDGASLDGAIIPIFCKWSFGIINNEKIKIGCEIKTINEWGLFFKSNEIYSTKRNTDEFKQIEAVYLALKAYLTHLNS